MQRKFHSFINVSDVYKSGLCTQCGACIVSCPKDNLLFKRDKCWNYQPYILEAFKCKDCQVCLKVCPGWEVDFTNITNFLFPNSHSNYFIGNYRSLFLGYSSENAIRSLSSSGGVTTSLLIYALEKK